jgi:hypothetical protein
MISVQEFSQLLLLPTIPHQNIEEKIVGIDPIPAQSTTAKTRCSRRLSGFGWSETVEVGMQALATGIDQQS